MSEERFSTRHAVLLVVASAIALLLILGLTWLATGPVVTPPTDLASRSHHDAADGARSGGAAADANAQAANDTEPPTRRAADVVGAVPPVALRVVDAARQPVAGATVRIDPNATEIALWDLADAEPRLGAIAAQTSDEAGLVHVLLPRGRAMVIARKGDAYVQHWVDVDDAIADPIELQLLVDRELLVCTRLADGTAAPHVPVELVYSWEWNIPPERLDCHVLGRTDENGEFVVRHAQRLFRYTPSAPLVLLRPLIVGTVSEPTRVSLDAAHLRVELVCAPHGAIRGTSFARDGQAVGAPLEVVLKVYPGDGEPKPVVVPRWPEPASGAWLLHPLALGARWQIEGEHYEPIEVLGPRHHGEIVAVEQRRWRTEGRLRFTLQAPDGSVLADAPVQVDSDQREATVVRTDLVGGVDIVRRADERSVRIVATSRRASGVLPIPIGAAALPASLDVGVVRLEPQQLLVQGVVVDAASGLPLTAGLLAFDPASSSALIARTNAAADGAFELWGHTNATLVLHASYGRRWLVCEVQPGARDLVLRLAVRRHLFVSLLFDAEIDDEALQIDVEPHGVGSTYVREIGRRLHVLGLPEGGEPTLVVATAGYPVLRVPATAWQHSARGAAVTVDLRGRLAMFTVAATRGGEPVDASFRLLAGTPEDREADTLSAGRPLVLSTDRTWRALVLPETGGGGTIDIALRPGQNVVELPGPARVHCSCENDGGDLGDVRLTFQLLRLRFDEPLLARPEDDDNPPAALPATLEALGNDKRNVTRECSPADTARAGQFWIGLRGRYALFVILEHRGHEVLLAQPAVEFDVVAFDLELPIVVPLQPAALAAARLELARAEGRR